MPTRNQPFAPADATPLWPQRRPFLRYATGARHPHNLVPTDRSGDKELRHARHHHPPRGPRPPVDQPHDTTASFIEKGARRRKAPGLPDTMGRIARC
jgi:hypothetical protein